MNRIAAIRARSRFMPEEHLVIAIDGVPLDELLDATRPGSDVAGLVPSLLGWFDDDKDSVTAWERILPEAGCSGYAPLLICPDDLDYSCSVVMAEVVAQPDVIRWDRLGFDATRVGVVGSCIRWEPAFGQYRFRRAEYEACLAVFRSVNAELSAVADAAHSCRTPMSFICPDCSGRRLRIAASLELPPDRWWDEITLQVVECPECGFRGAAVYEESRRGALDSEAWNHRGYRLAPGPLQRLAEEVAACPEPRNAACRCTTHQKWGRTDAAGQWAGRPESEGDFPLTPA